MTGFSKGDQVVIRFGERQGQAGKVIKSQLADIYEVKAEDGSVLCYCRKGLRRAKDEVRPPGCGTGRGAWGLER